MPIYARCTKKTDYIPAPEGLWTAICCDVFDRGIVETKYGPKVKIRISWQLEERNPKTNKRFIVWRDFSPSLEEKSHLKPILEAWRGRKFTDVEREEFDIEKLIGVCCQVQILHNAGDEGTLWANVQAVVPYPRDMVKLRIEDYTRQIDREKNYEEHPDGKEPGDDTSVPF